MKKAITYIIILLVLLSIVFCITSWECIVKIIGTYIVDFVESKKDLPLFGEYICQELDLCLVFNEHELYVASSDYKTKVYVDFHGRLLWGEGVIAFYYWDQINNVIEISFGQPPSGISKGVTYLFVHKTD